MIIVLEGITQEKFEDVIVGLNNQLGTELDPKSLTGIGAKDGFRLGYQFFPETSRVNVMIFEKPLWVASGVVKQRIEELAK